jgi:hypothetical protein
MGNLWSRVSQARFPLEFASPLGIPAWFALAGVPVAIIALYFLKLRRRPVRVPSTLLWRKSLEDLHVNSLFQRLRRNLLLFLQLLAVALVMLALAGPRMKGLANEPRRYVLMIDQSASMSATDIAPSRLARAKEEAKKVIANMNSDDLAMVISFSDQARVVSSYTGDTRLLNQRIESIEPTQSTTSLREGLQVAAGLANPSKQLDVGEGVVATSVITPKLFIYTDGGFGDVEGFSLGNLEPEVVVIGPPPPAYKRPGEASGPAADKVGESHPSDNVAILALQARRDDEKPDVHQVFGRVHNYRDADVTTEAQLYRHAPDRPSDDGALVDAIALKVPAGSEQSFKFDLADATLAPYEVRLTVNDALAADNRAYTVVGTARKAHVLVVTPGNRYLEDTLKTPSAEQLADISIVSPEQAKEEGLARDLKGGRYDLVIFDGVKPDTAPEANTLYFGELPPGAAYANAKEVQQPVILDWDISHPVLHYVRDLSLIVVAAAKVVELPPGAKSLIDSDRGSVAFSVPREGFTDVVVTFPLLMNTAPNTNWFRYISFPLFIMNSIQTLGNVRENTSEEVAQVGKPLVLRAETIEKEISVTSADGLTTDRVPRSPQGTFVYNKDDKTGVYLAEWEPKGQLPVAVNLFSPRESDLATRGMIPAGTPESAQEGYKIKIGYNPVTAVKQAPPIQKDIWWYFALLILGVLVVEWYVYNRRVYI